MWLMDNESYQISTTGFAGTSESPEHYEKNKFEKEFVLNKVRTLFGEHPQGSRISWKGYPHDFGTYYELTLFWNGNNEKLDKKAWEWIAKIESHDWEKEQLQLEELWDIRDMNQLAEDNKVFDAIHTETNKQ